MYRQYISSPQLGWSVKPQAFPCGIAQSPQLTEELERRKRRGGEERDRATVNRFKTKPSLPWELRFFYSCPATAAEYRCVVISSHCWGEQRSHEIHFIDFGLGVMARDNHERIIDEEHNGRWHMPNTKSLISVSPTLLFLVWFNFLPLPPTRLLGYSAAKEWIKSKRATDRHFWPTVHLSECCLQRRGALMM